MAAEITNERLLKEIRNLNARTGDIMRRLQKMERDIIATNDKPKGVIVKRDNQETVF